jgi:hypothetical protein
MKTKTKTLLKATPAIVAFCLMQAIAIVAVFAALQVIAPSLGNLRAYVENDLPTLLGTVSVLVGITYIFKNL